MALGNVASLSDHKEEVFICTITFLSSPPLGGIHVPISSAYTCLGFANAVLGTNHQRIRDLDARLAPLLIYDGSLGDLVPESGKGEILS